MSLLFQKCVDYNQVVIRQTANGFALVAILIIAALVIGIGATLGYQKLTTKPSPSPQPSAISQSLTPDDSSSEALAQDETATWKTYTNTKFKYSLRLPANYSALDAEFNSVQDEPNAFMVSFLKYSSEKAKEIAYAAKDPSREKAYYDSLSVIIQGNDSCPTSAPKYTKQKAEITIEGINTIKWSGVDSSFGDPFLADTIIYVPRNTQCYTVFYFKDPSNVERSENNLNQILSTFKFLD